MAIDTHDAMATRASFMAPFGDGQAPFLLVALKQWREIQRRIEEDAAMVAAEDLRMRQRREILRRLNTLDTGPTEEDRRAERPAEIGRAIRTEEDLKWGRLSAGIAGGVPGRSVLPL